MRNWRSSSVLQASLWPPLSLACCSLTGLLFWAVLSAWSTVPLCLSSDVTDQRGLPWPPCTTESPAPYQPLHYPLSLCCCFLFFLLPHFHQTYHMLICLLSACTLPQPPDIHESRDLLYSIAIIYPEPKTILGSAWYKFAEGKKKRFRKWNTLSVSKDLVDFFSLLW